MNRKQLFTPGQLIERVSGARLVDIKNNTAYTFSYMTPTGRLYIRESNRSFASENWQAVLTEIPTKQLERV
jgi:hypothetical protein